MDISSLQVSINDRGMPQHASSMLLGYEQISGDISCLAAHPPKMMAAKNIFFIGKTQLVAFLSPVSSLRRYP